MKDKILSELRKSASVLLNFIDDERKIMAINTAAEIMASSLYNGKKIIACGNGGSMSDAMHFASELTGRYRENRKPFPAIAISDPSYLTCTSNDMGYEYSFSRSIMALAEKGDTVLIISTSAQSQNCITAARAAIVKGAAVVTLTGNPDKHSDLRDISDLDICVDHNGYADRIQEVHIKIIHVLVMLIEEMMIDK